MGGPDKNNNINTNGNNNNGVCKPADESNLQHKTDGSIALCASCDRCRARKTKCDGKRPCSNCANKYMKKHKLTSIEGIDVAEFECVYSPAKRRGPVPGRSGQTRKASDAFASGGKGAAANGNNGNGVAPMEVDQNQPPLAVVSSNNTNNNSNMTMQQQMTQQMNLLQKLHNGANGGGDSNNMMMANDAADEPRTRRVRRESTDESGSEAGSATAGGNGNAIPKTVASNTPLLEASNVEGNRLRAYYRMSIDELFRLPLTPTNDEYCTKWNKANPATLMTTTTLPAVHLAALCASRFAEIALGAVVHQEISLAMELCNAVVHCLRECVQEPVQDAYLYEVARAYFLLGVFRAFRGDMERYFKYRRVAMTYASKLPNDTDTQILMAAISYLDAWAYMIYNADEQKLPIVNATVPTPLSCNGGDGTDACNNKIAADPNNRNWIQGAPPVYLNNEAPLPARALDALACAVRTCCDQANSRFVDISRAADLGALADEVGTKQSITTSAVMANENELCSRNLVLSAFTLMQQYEATTKSAIHRNQGQRMVISAMDAFLENNDDEEGESEGFSDSQIQSLLSVCNTAIENPFLLFHAGPTYHMVSNAAIMLCHLLNGMYAMMMGPDRGKMGDLELAMFEEALDTLIATRKLLTIHRRKLPVKLRCHGIPRPSLNALVTSSANDDGDNEFPSIQASKPLIDLGETVLCSCRGCQGFVLMACSPCVAAERAMAAQDRLEVEDTQETEAIETGDLERELDDLGAEFNLDDDALLGMISQLITN